MILGTFLFPHKASLILLRTFVFCSGADSGSIDCDILGLSPHPADDILNYVVHSGRSRFGRPFSPSRRFILEWAFIPDSDGYKLEWYTFSVQSRFRSGLIWYEGSQASHTFWSRPTSRLPWKMRSLCRLMTWGGRYSRRFYWNTMFRRTWALSVDPTFDLSDRPHDWCGLDIVLLLT